jgi:hypothetical protein
VFSQSKIPNWWLFTRSASPAFGPLMRLISQMTWNISQPASRLITFPFCSPWFLCHQQ